MVPSLNSEETIIKAIIIRAIIEIIEIIEIIVMRIVNALEIIVQDKMIEVKNDTINETKGSKEDLPTMIGGVNKIEGKREKIKMQEIKKKNTDDYEIIIAILYSILIFFYYANKAEQLKSIKKEGSRTFAFQ